MTVTEQGHEKWRLRIFITPKAFGIFTIDRRKLPYEDSGYVLNVPKVHQAQPAAPVSVAKLSEPPPTQWELFLTP